MRRNEQNVPPLLTCREVLTFATLAGARFAGLDGKVGTLAPGKDGDIVMLRADTFDLWPLNNAPSVVANMMNPSHVDAVFVAAFALFTWLSRRRSADAVKTGMGGPPPVSP